MVGGYAGMLLCSTVRPVTGLGLVGLCFCSVGSYAFDLLPQVDLVGFLWHLLIDVVQGCLKASLYSVLEFVLINIQAVDHLVEDVRHC